MANTSSQKRAGSQAVQIRKSLKDIDRLLSRNFLTFRTRESAALVLFGVLRNRKPTDFAVGFLNLTQRRQTDPRARMIRVPILHRFWSHGSIGEIEFISVHQRTRTELI